MNWFKLRKCLPYTAIAMSALEAFRADIEAEYGCTLEEVNGSGGLDWYEIWCFITGRPLYPIVEIDHAICKEVVLQRVLATEHA